MTPEAFTARYMPQFNAQQKAAVFETDGAVLLLAVPGSGKTTVLVTRLGFMTLCRGIAPGSILTVTYTVAATQQMRARYTALFPELSGRTPEFRTINGLSAKIIDACSRLRGPAFALQENDGELAALVGRIYQALNGDYPTDATIRDIRTAITYCKNMMLRPEQIRAQHFDIPQFAELYTRYCQALRRARQMDYDDQMTYALAILQKYPDILSDFQARYPYICVDESQDTSRIQHAIISLLAKKTGNIFMVGDEDQSIYGFRAACPDVLLHFSEVYPGAKTLLMEENFRSTPEILRAANAFISRNASRHPKTIRPVRQPGAQIALRAVDSRQAQFRYLLALARQQDASFAVLFRNNDSALPLIDALERSGTPYRCRSFDETFFSHRIVCDVRDILHFAAVPEDTDCFLRIYYKFGAMLSKEAALRACAQSMQSHTPVLTCVLAQSGLPEPCREAIRKLHTCMQSLPGMPGASLMRTIWGTAGYGRFVSERRLDPGKFSILSMLAAREPSAEAFLQRLDTLRQLIRTHENPPQARLTLSTIHASKGLEYDTVYLLDIHDGILPNRPEDAAGTPEEQRQYEEERRLFYVALTRAKNKLILFEYPDLPSAFIREIRSGLPVSALCPEAGTLGPGSVIWHKSFGRGRILSVDGTLAAIRFDAPGETGVRRFDLVQSVRNGFLSLQAPQHT